MNCNCEYPCNCALYKTIKELCEEIVEEAVGLKWLEENPNYIPYKMQRYGLI